MNVARAHLIAVCAAAACVVLTGCGGSTTPGDTTQTDPDEIGQDQTGESGGPRVVASTSILGDIVSTIVGDDATVEVLMEPGVDPHGYSPSAAQAQSIREADLVVVNGLQLEESLIDTLESAEDDGANVLRVGEQLDPVAYEEGEGHATHGVGEAHGEEDQDHDEEHETPDPQGADDHADHEGGEAHDAGHNEDAEEDAHDHGGFDPHVWLDLERMADGVEIIASAIAEVDDTLDDARWETRGQVYAKDLRDLDDEIVQLLAAVPDERRELVTNHDAFGYFARRYDFEVIGTVIPGASTQVDTSAKDFGDLAQVITDHDVPAIFSETTASDRLATALAQEVGRPVDIVALYSGSLGEPGSGAETYMELVRFDAHAIADALS